MYECVVVTPYRTDPKILNAEGDRDGESDADDEAIEELMPRRSHSATSSTRGTDGSSDSWDGTPMDVEES
jgi:hypothetical protein